jgi:hydroxypyruvate isomerase
MERRKFLQQGTLAGLSTLAFNAATAAALPSAPEAGKTFNLNYAPHDGMFKNSAGSNVLDQIQFMYDQGFRSFEDNGLMNRDVAEQEKIGNLLAKLGMQMGVFVIDGGDNWKTSLTTGKQEFRDTFVKICRKALEMPNGPHSYLVILSATSLSAYRQPTLSKPSAWAPPSWNHKVW